MDEYDPELYELLHRGTPGDVEYYVKAAQGAARILELGCGYGRILAALHRADPTMDLVGLDLHAGLLTHARQRLPPAVDLLLADMRRFALQPAFDAVFAPYSTLWCLESEQDVADCFASVFAHLVPGGRFVFDGYAADSFHGVVEPEPGDEDPLLIGEVYVGEQGFRVFEHSDWRPNEQAFSVRYRHQPVDGGPTIDSVIEHRYLLADQARDGLRRAGFAPVRLFAGFQGQPFHAEAEQLVVEAIRPPNGGLEPSR